MCYGAGVTLFGDTIPFGRLFAIIRIIQNVENLKTGWQQESPPTAVLDERLSHARVQTVVSRPHSDAPGVASSSSASSSSSAAGTTFTEATRSSSSSFCSLTPVVARPLLRDRTEPLAHNRALLCDEQQLIVVGGCCRGEREQPIVVALELDGDHALAAALLRTEVVKSEALPEAQACHGHELLLGRLATLWHGFIAWHDEHVGDCVALSHAHRLDAARLATARA